jgi:hypothetical protein
VKGYDLVDQAVTARSPQWTDPPDIEEPSSSTKSFEDFHRKYWALLILAVLAAFGPLLLTNQPLWDDWVNIAYANAGTLWDLFKQMGRREQFVLMQPFAALGAPRACTAMVLLLSCALGPLTYTIIRRATHWPAIDAFWAALLTVLIPLNQARFALSTEPYAFSCVFFALSLVVLLHDLDRPALGRRALIVLLLIMAFSTNSFLVLAWIAPAIVMHDAWRKVDPEASPVQRGTAALWAAVGRSELLLLPPLYWLAKTILQPTYGLYANYNKFQISVPAALWKTLTTLASQFGRNAAILLPARSDLPELAIAVAVVLLLFLLAARFWGLPLATADTDQSDPGWLGRGLPLAVAFALAISALFPYVMVGEPPRFSGLWETRHQTTLMMVGGFGIFAFLRLVLPRRFLWKTAAVISAGFLALDMSVTHRLVVDALETHAIADLFRQRPSPPGTMLFVVENDRGYRALGRFFAFYELSWLANLGQAGNPRLADSNQEIVDPATGSYPDAPVPAVVARLVRLCADGREYPQYGFGGFVSNGQIETVRLVANRPPPSPFEAVRQAVHEIGSAKPDQSVPPMVKMEREIGPIGGACHSPCCSG